MQPASSRRTAFLSEQSNIKKKKQQRCWITSIIFQHFFFFFEGRLAVFVLLCQGVYWFPERTVEQVLSWPTARRLFRHGLRGSTAAVPWAIDLKIEGGGLWQRPENLSTHVLPSPFLTRLYLAASLWKMRWPWCGRAAVQQAAQLPSPSPCLHCAAQWAAVLHSDPDCLITFQPSPELRFCL